MREDLIRSMGSFKIDHPDPSKESTHNLFHSFVESPTEGDNLYRYQVETKENRAVIVLPSYFKYLNTNEMIWVSPVSSFGRGYAIMSDDQVTVDIVVDQDGKYNVLIVATRKDADAKRYWNGVERLKAKFKKYRVK